jgi:hypothetical protein
MPDRVTLARTMERQQDDGLLDALDATIEAARRLTTLAERLLTRAASGPLLTDRERADGTSELATAKEGLEQLHTLALLTRQKLRPM